MVSCWSKVQSCVDILFAKWNQFLPLLPIGYQTPTWNELVISHHHIHILQPSVFSKIQGQMTISFYKQPWNHSTAHSIMTIIFYWLYPQATPEQKPLCQIKEKMYQWNYWRRNAFKKHRRFSLTEPETDVASTVMADVSLSCPIRDLSSLAFLQASQKSAQFFKTFLVFCSSTSTGQEL